MLPTHTKPHSAHNKHLPTTHATLLLLTPDMQPLEFLYFSHAYFLGSSRGYLTFLEVHSLRMQINYFDTESNSNNNMYSTKCIKYKLGYICIFYLYHFGYFSLSHSPIFTSKLYGLDIKERLIWQIIYMIFHYTTVTIIKLYKIDIIFVVAKRMNIYLFYHLFLSPFWIFWWVV